MNRLATLNLAPNSSLEELLLALSKYGRPSLSVVSQGWHCWVTMHVSSKGIEFKVSSEFDHPSPMSATIECYARLGKALKDLESYQP